MCAGAILGGKTRLQFVNRMKHWDWQRVSNGNLSRLAGAGIVEIVRFSAAVCHAGALNGAWALTRRDGIEWDLRNSDEISRAREVSFLFS